MFSRPLFNIPKYWNVTQLFLSEAQRHRRNIHIEICIRLKCRKTDSYIAKLEQLHAKLLCFDGPNSVINQEDNWWKSVTLSYYTMARLPCLTVMQQLITHHGYDNFAWPIAYLVPNRCPNEWMNGIVQQEFDIIAILFWLATNGFIPYSCSVKH